MSFLLMLGLSGCEEAGPSAKAETMHDYMLNYFLRQEATRNMKISRLPVFLLEVQLMCRSNHDW